MRPTTPNYALPNGRRNDRNHPRAPPRADGSVQCGDQEMMNRMMVGGDVCCDYTDGRNCGTFPVSGPQDTAEECADTGAVDTTSLSLRMPLNRKCVPPPRPLARFADSTSTAILVQLPVLGDRAAVPECRPAKGRRHRRGLRALSRPHRGESLLRLPDGRSKRTTWT